MGLPTGIRTLDDALGGLQPGRFYLVAAAPGGGSSLIATAAARTSALDQHQPVLYAASGLTRADIAARIVAAHLPVDYRRLRAGRLTPTEQDDTAALHHHLASAPLYIDDGTDLTTDAIAESVPDLPGLALVVVDRLQTTEDPRLPLSGPSQITDAAQALAHLARTHELPVLAAVDTDDPQVIAALSLDITVTLTRDADQIHATITERDLGPQTTLTLHADLAHARITDPAALSASPTTPAPPPTASLHTPAQPPPAPLQAPTSPSPDPTPAEP
ncbi:DnaB-like helicase C-terminal domain-containing protein, partial [Streptomyces sp. NRRL B-3229]|uniref:DnaB-like helicase C-terminal domain-containing protein n=1 Tax=Streptomyces sp. NRRL B-3229 TaxID=1463836 RepID=UPI0004C069EA